MTSIMPSAAVDPGLAGAMLAGAQPTDACTRAGTPAAVEGPAVTLLFAGVFAQAMLPSAAKLRPGAVLDAPADDTTIDMAETGAVALEGPEAGAVPACPAGPDRGPVKVHPDNGNTPHGASANGATVTRSESGMTVELPSGIVLALHERAGESVRGHDSPPGIAHDDPNDDPATAGEPATENANQPVGALTDAGAPVARTRDAAAANPAQVVSDPRLLQPEFRAKLERVIARMKEDYGRDVTVAETWRSQARQEVLHEQGRTAPGPVVTWTLHSKHTQGLAADLLVDGRWDNAEGYARLQQTAKEEGLRTLGARDPGHVEFAASPLPDGFNGSATVTDVSVAPGRPLRSAPAAVTPALVAATMAASTAAPAAAPAAARTVVTTPASTTSNTTATAMRRQRQQRQRQQRQRQQRQRQQRQQQQRQQQQRQQQLRQLQLRQQQLRQLQLMPRRVRPSPFLVHHADRRPHTAWHAWRAWRGLRAWRG